MELKVQLGNGLNKILMVENKEYKLNLITF